MVRASARLLAKGHRLSALYLNGLELELLRALNGQAAVYVVIGGHAVQFHGHVRAAKDLDLFVEPSSANAGRIQTALKTE